MRTARLLLAGFLAAGFPLLAAQEGEQPSAEALVKTFQEKMGELKKPGGRVSRAEVQQAAAAVLEGVQIADLSLADIELLARERIIQFGGASAPAVERLADFAAAETADGAAAACLRLSLSEVSSPDELVEPLRAALTHPGLKEALGAGRTANLFGVLGDAPPEALAACFDQIVALEALLQDDLPPEAAADLPGLVMALLELQEERYAPGREKLRERVLAVVSAAAGRASDERLASHLRRQAQILNGAYARGQLVGHEAPPLHFAWTSSKDTLTTLADLKGKVVVLDFWATWCGPCVASFPKIWELADHYSGSAVAIVGVTSLQGKHYGPGGQVDCEGDPEKEYALMEEYISQKDINWTIAFSEEEVFNPEYGVNGIPHVVILDVAGKVRFRGLHPADPFEEKTEKIDQLLKEAGLPCPGAE
ncbi:MAG: TlpA family protein disulfide reductase [Planctomycetes bacterium]|nr:TlpA family protein disulfide reductase [Planctomycetota bacterium]